MKALIALEDGTTFHGNSFTGEGEALGEIVFNTSLSGYQEILTDPSYTGQMVTMTNPLIGNYGINDEDMESAAIHPKAFFVKEYCPYPSNFRATKTLAEFLKEFGVLGIEGFDTRALVRHIRTAGAMKAAVSTKELDPAALTAKAKNWSGIIGQNLVEEVSCKEPYGWAENAPVLGSGFTTAKAGGEEGTERAKFRVAAFDFGIKYNQLRILASLGCAVQVVPWNTTADDILSLNPDGIFLSNGPGDPEGVPEVIATIKELLGKKPIFGICLGHQLLALACGCSAYKLKFGHRGGNQPVKNLANGRVEITSQNHGFCIDSTNLPPELEITHINLNDNSIEGIRHKEYPAFSVQYHPEYAPGPRDAHYLFDEFLTLMAQ